MVSRAEANLLQGRLPDLRDDADIEHVQELEYLLDDVIIELHKVLLDSAAHFPSSMHENCLRVSLKRKIILNKSMRAHTSLSRSQFLSTCTQSNVVFYLNYSY